MYTHAVGERVLLSLYLRFYMLMVVCFLVQFVIFYCELIIVSVYVCTCVCESHVLCAVKVSLHHSAGSGQVFYVRFLV